jgi:DNA-binding CsgD family transcriptional regulator
MNFNVEQWDGMVGDLYSTVLQPELLLPTICRANRLLESDLCHIVGMNPQGKETMRLLTREDSAQMGDLYASHYAGIDPRRAFMLSAPVGQTYRCASYFDEKFVARSEFYQDFLIPNGFRYVIGSCLHRSADQQIFVGFNHGAGRADFTDHEQSFFRMYSQHLLKVMASMLEHAGVARALVSEQALDQLAYGVMGVRADGALTFCNRVAETQFAPLIAEEVLKGRLRDAGKLAALTRDVAASGQARVRRFHPRGSADAVFAAVYPLAHDAGGTPRRGGFHDMHRTERIVVLSAGRQRAGASPRQLMELFSLTAAEARLADHLRRGVAVGDYALMFNVSIATVRTQLRALLRKTGEERQQDLVHMLASLPPGTPS